MKTKFRYCKSLALTSLLTFGAASMLTASAEPGGKDILHLDLTKSFTSVDEMSVANGSVRLKFHQQGNSTVQSLDLNVSLLDGNATYALLASFKGADSEPREVAQFQTDAEGIAKVRYMKVGNVNGKGYKPGKGRFLLPEGLNQLSQVRQIAIQKVVGELGGVSVLEGPVMRAELEYPEHLSYLAKRNVSTDAHPASLRIQANDQGGQFRLNVGKLTPSFEYYLILNGGEPEVFSTDAKGNLVVRTAIENPLDVLALETVEISDGTRTSSELKVSLP